MWSVSSVNVLSCLQCPRHRHPTNKFKACKLLSLKEELHKARAELEQMHSHEVMDIFGAFDLTGIWASDTASSTSEDLLNKIYNNSQRAYLNLLAVRQFDNTVTHELEQELDRLATRLQKIICQLSDVLRYGLANRHGESVSSGVSNLAEGAQTTGVSNGNGPTMISVECVTQYYSDYSSQIMFTAVFIAENMGMFAQLQQDINSVLQQELMP